MEYLPMWPKGHDKDSPRGLPLGVHIVYEEGDDDELFHLLSFLRSYFELTEEDFTDENINVAEERFPLLWFDEAPITLKQLLKATLGKDKIGSLIDFGFLHTDQATFRAYKEYLDADGAATNGLREFFSEIEDEFFGRKDHLN